MKDYTKERRELKEVGWQRADRTHYDPATKTAEGRVVEVLHEHGCGEVPGDPMVVVELDDGRRDGFWREELAPSDRVRAAVPSGAGA